MIFWLALLFLSLAVWLLLVTIRGVLEDRRNDRRIMEGIAQYVAKRTHARPRIFVSYSMNDYGVARNVRERLLARGADVDMMNPDSLWRDPLGHVFPSLHRAGSVVVVSTDNRGAWVDMEAEVAGMFGASVVELTRESKLDEVVETAFQLAETTDWQARAEEDASSSPEARALRVLSRFSETNRRVDEERRPIEHRYAEGSHTAAYLHHTSDETERGTQVLHWMLFIVPCGVGALLSLAIALLLFGIHYLI